MEASALQYPDYFGYVRDAAGNVLAALRADRSWEAGQGEVAEQLNAEINDFSPAYGRPGVHQLELAAGLLGGNVVWLVPPQPEQPGRIY